MNFKLIPAAAQLTLAWTEFGRAALVVAAGDATNSSSMAAAPPPKSVL